MAIVLLLLDSRDDDYGARFTCEVFLRFINQFFECILVDRLDFSNIGFESLLIHTIWSIGFSMATIEIPEETDQQRGYAGVLSARETQHCDWEAKQRRKRLVEDPKPEQKKKAKLGAVDVKDDSLIGQYDADEQHPLSQMQWSLLDIVGDLIDW